MIAVILFMVTNFAVFPGNSCLLKITSVVPVSDVFGGGSTWGNCYVNKNSGAFTPRSCLFIDGKSVI